MQRFLGLENLLRTCQFLNVPASSLFAPSGPTPANIAAAKEAIALAGNRGVSPSRHASEIRQALLVALDEAVPRSLSQVAQALGYTNTDRLYQADRKLCHKIAARYRQSGRSHWWRKPGATRICDAAQLKEILERSLKSNEPTSVHQIAASLGYSNDGYVHQKYPEICRAIGAKIALTKQAESPTIRRTPRKCDPGASSANPEGCEPPPRLLEFVSPAGSCAGTMRSTCGEAQGTRCGAQSRDGKT